ncbi:hypothetical protein BDD12DRAFT_811273 [Trichophaea hybrida]|nr:hypothetical protein BDD12DRAFT_811273 [Trichophaea hybrida]
MLTGLRTVDELDRWNTCAETVLNELATAAGLAKLEHVETSTNEEDINQDCDCCCNHLQLRLRSLEDRQSVLHTLEEWAISVSDLLGSLVAARQVDQDGETTKRRRL